jgi:hypothetical protein
MLQGKSIKLAVSQPFEAEPEEIKKQAGNSCNSDRGQQGNGGPNQTFNKSRLLQRFLFGFAHNLILICVKI